MGAILTGLSRVPWSTLHDEQGPAREIPSLLSKVAWGDRETASIALDELGDRICYLGFVVSEATGPAVPFLLELVGAPYVPCKTELLELLTKFCNARQWSTTASAAGAKCSKGYKEQIGWEAASLASLLFGVRVVEGLTSSVDPAVAEAARTLLRACEVRREQEQ